MTSKNSMYFKAIYQDYDWCYQKFIIEGLNHQEMANECGATKRVVEKWCTEKHRLTQKFRQKNKQMTSIQRDLIIGSMLGDGHIDKRETQPVFIVSHAENQKDYLFWKYNIIKDFCNIPPTYHKEKEIKHFKTGDYVAQPYYRISTRVHDCFIEIRKMDVKELVDNLNEFSFSILMLDDACRTDLWSYCVAPYTKEEREYMIKIFKEKFNINGYIRETDDRYMFFNAIDSTKIDTIILNNIPNDIDIIEDKILNNNKIKKLSNYRIVVMNDGSKLGLSAFCKKNHISTCKKDTSYSIITRLYDEGYTNEKELLLKFKEVHYE